MAKRSKLLTEPWHLVARFVRSMSPAAPNVVDENWVDDHLLASERRLWTQMTNQDRRHSIGVARRFLAARPEASRAEIAGALLHDVGKIECELGTLGRVVATVVGPHVVEQFRTYHDHEAIGARLVAEAGSDPVTIELVEERGPVYDLLEVADY